MQKIIDEIIAKYMKMHEKNPRYVEYLRTKKYGYEMIARHFSGERVLELGSDGAATSAILARASKHLDIVDCEDKISHLIAKDDALKKAHFIKSFWEDFKPEYEYSDILLTDSLEHVGDAVGILALIKTWLAPSGKLHIIVPNALSLHRLIGVKMGFLNDAHDFNDNDIASGHVRVYDFDTLNADIKASGLSLISMQGVQFKPLSDAQLSSFSAEYKDALASLNELLPRHCAEIYALCGR